MIPTCSIVWYRRDLRVHDHPGLTAAVAEQGTVVPVFVVDDALLDGRYRSPGRHHFLLGCLQAVDLELRERGARLVVRAGRPEQVLCELAREVDARRVYWSSDVSPYARARDRRVTDALGAAGVEARPSAGNYCADVSRPRTADGRPYTVFTAFWRAWQTLERRPVHRAPTRVTLPEGLEPGELLSPSRLGAQAPPEAAVAPGEAQARTALTRWLAQDMGAYSERHDRLAGGTSLLSPHLRWGCVSPREIEQRAQSRSGAGAEAFVRQLAWREFYAHVLLCHPEDLHLEHQPRLRALEWEAPGENLDAWREGHTGYPLVDAGMRQLARSGWMHNRARLVVGSFLTKDLHLDWRLGEEHFARLLLDGEPAQNNGNWQWIASTGVDPAPYSRRMFNPTRQQQRFDPDGDYVRRWIPELREVPAECLLDPSSMTRAQQSATGCVMGRDYPAPIVDHAHERRRALERYGAAGR